MIYRSKAYTKRNEWVAPLVLLQEAEVLRVQKQLQVWLQSEALVFESIIVFVSNHWVLPFPILEINFQFSIHPHFIHRFRLRFMICFFNLTVFHRFLDRHGWRRRRKRKLRCAKWTPRRKTSERPTPLRCLVRKNELETKTGT